DLGEAVSALRVLAVALLDQSGVPVDGVELDRQCAYVFRKQAGKAAAPERRVYPQTGAMRDDAAERLEAVEDRLLAGDDVGAAIEPQAFVAQQVHEVRDAKRLDGIEAGERSVEPRGAQPEGVAIEPRVPRIDRLVQRAAAGLPEPCEFL